MGKTYQIRIDQDAIALAKKACRPNKRTLPKEVSFAIVSHYKSMNQSQKSKAKRQ